MKRVLPFLLLVAGTMEAQFSERPPDLVVPVVGSSGGLSGASFKTGLQITNQGETRMTGWLYLRPHGRAMAYDLAPHQTLSWDDVVAALGADGLGSLDVLVDSGGLPTVVARAFDDQPEGTTGVGVPAIPSPAVLARGDAAALIAPADPARFRWNIGIRTLVGGAELELVVYDRNSAERHRRTWAAGAHHFEQHPAPLITGIDLAPDDSVMVRVISGAAIVYATTVDNQTNDSAIQVLRK